MTYGNVILMYRILTRETGLKHIFVCTKTGFMKRLLICLAASVLIYGEISGRTVVPREEFRGDREYWIHVMDKIARPVLSALGEDRLKETIPVGRSSAAMSSSREFVTHMESAGRTIAGIAPWIELGPDSTPEGELRAEYINMVCKALANSTDPESNDYFDSHATRQILVNSAFLIQGLLAAPKHIWSNLDSLTQSRLIEQWKSTRTMVPGKNNWYLFSAMVECGLKVFGGEWNYDIVKRAIDAHKEWYAGDGIYGDGEVFHLDYYNSYVIQPMLLQVLEIACIFDSSVTGFMELHKRRMQRFAEIQERMIAPDGSYPLIGRSITYRLGAFQVLSLCALRDMPPASLSEGQVRNALTAAIGRQMEHEGTFDKDGWLTIGVCGEQPELGDSYLSTPCVYLTSLVFLPLGLPAGHPFWTADAEPWTSVKAFSGKEFPIDKFIKE